MKYLTAAFAVALHATVLVAQTPDTLRGSAVALTRAGAIAAALANNPQLEIAREQTAQARARRVSAVAIPDPAFTYSLDNQPGFLQLGSAGQRNAAVGIAVPFPGQVPAAEHVATRGRPLVRVSATRGCGSSSPRRRRARTTPCSSRLGIARSSQTSRELARDFLAKTKARFEGGHGRAKLDVHPRAGRAGAGGERPHRGRARRRRRRPMRSTACIGRPLGTPIAPRRLARRSAAAARRRRAGAGGARCASGAGVSWRASRRAPARSTTLGAGVLAARLHPRRRSATTGPMARACSSPRASRCRSRSSTGSTRRARSPRASIVSAS